MMSRSLLIAVFAIASCDGFMVPANMRGMTAASPAAAVTPLDVTMMARAAPTKRAVRKPAKKVVKKPVKRVVRKPVKKVVRKSNKGGSYALSQRQSVGAGTKSLGTVVGGIATELFTQQQLAFIALWVVLALRFLVFY